MASKTERQRQYRARLRERGLAALGRECVFCAASEVQAAHVRPTGLSGRNGRGLDRRWLDVLRYPDAYRPMCAACHRTFDALVKIALAEEVEEVPF